MVRRLWYCDVQEWFSVKVGALGVDWGREEQIMLSATWSDSLRNTGSFFGTVTFTRSNNDKRWTLCKHRLLEPDLWTHAVHCVQGELRCLKYADAKDPAKTFGHFTSFKGYGSPGLRGFQGVTFQGTGVFSGRCAPLVGRTEVDIVGIAYRLLVSSYCSGMRWLLDSKVSGLSLLITAASSDGEGALIVLVAAGVNIAVPWRKTLMPKKHAEIEELAGSINLRKST